MNDQSQRNAVACVSACLPDCLPDGALGSSAYQQPLKLMLRQVLLAAPETRRRASVGLISDSPFTLRSGPSVYGFGRSTGYYAGGGRHVGRHARDSPDDVMRNFRLNNACLPAITSGAAINVRHRSTQADILKIFIHQHW